MADTLSVKITADIAEMQAKFAVARAEAAGLTRELNQLARATAAGTIDPAGSARLNAAAGAMLQARQRADELAQALGRTHQVAGGVGGALEQMAGSFNTALKLTGIGLAIDGLTRLMGVVSELGQRATEVRAFSEILGVTTDEFQAMGVAAGRGGTTQEVFARAGEHMIAVLQKAREGSGQAVEKLRLLGVTVDEIHDPAFTLNNLFQLLHDRLTNSATAQATMNELVAQLGPRAALAGEAIKQYDGSQQGVQAAMAQVNGLSREQIDRLHEMGTWWAEVGRAVANAGGKMLIYAADAAKVRNADLGADIGGGGAGIPEKAAAAAADVRKTSTDAIATLNRAADTLTQITKSDIENVRDQIAAYRQGSAERLAAVQQLAHLTTVYYGAETDEARKSNRELLAEQRAFAEQRGAQAIALARDQATQLSGVMTISEAARLNLQIETWRELLAGEQLSATQRLEVQRDLDRAIAELAKHRFTEQQTILRSNVNTEISILSAQLEEERAILEEGIAAHRVSADQKFETLQELTLQEYAARLQGFQQEQALLVEGTAAYAENANQQRAIEAKLDADLAKLRRQRLADVQREEKQEATAWQGAIAEIGRAEGTMIGDLLSRRKTFAQSALQITAQFAQQEIANDLKAMTMRKLLHETGVGSERTLEQGGLLFHMFIERQKDAATLQSEAAKTAAVAAGSQARVAAEAAASAESKGVQAAAAGPQVMSDAARGAAGAFAALAGIPIIGPVLGAIAAGVTFTAIAAYEGAATALDIGAWNVPANMTARIHQGEMVIPRPFAEGMRASGALGGGGGAGGSAELHIHVQNHIHAIDTQTGAEFLRKNSKHIASAIAHEVRLFNPELRR